MKLGLLFSGGKDSTFAGLIASNHNHEIICLISILSKNEHSFMFHTPNISLAEKQAEAIGLPIILEETEGEKEIELEDLRKAIKNAKDEYGIEGIVTGAVESVYQASRVQEICSDIDLWCFNPLWQKDQIELLEELIENNFDVIISSIAGYPLDEKWLGRKINEESINELKQLQKDYEINPAGEGGEFESLVLDCPLFKKKLEIKDSEKEYENHSGIIKIKEVDLV